MENLPLRGTNSRLPFAVNAMHNSEIKIHVYAKQQK